MPIVTALLGLVVFVPPHAGAPVEPGRALADLMARGPAPGCWRASGLGGERTWWVAPHPADPACVLLLGEDGERAGRGGVRAFSRSWVAGMLVGGAGEIFFQNHVLEQPTLEEVGSDGRALLHAVWRPRVRHGGETARHVWFDARSGRVLRLEDRSHLDHPVRTLAWLGTDLGPLEAALGSRKGSLACRSEHRGPKAPDLGRTAARAPFPLLAPAYLPPGFVLTDARVRAWPLPRVADGDAEPRRRLHIAYLGYTDGLSTLSLGVALPEDMDALEEVVRSMRARTEDPEACPDLPQGSNPVEVEGLLVRRRRDRCRTVLRLDGLHGVSAALLGRNELPEDEYLKVIRSLERVVPAVGEGPEDTEDEDAPD